MAHTFQARGRVAAANGVCSRVVRGGEAAEDALTSEPAEPELARWPTPAFACSHGTHGDERSPDPPLKTILDHLPAMVAYWDRDLRNVVANAAYVQWFGRTPEEMRGMHIRDVLGPDLFELNLPYMERALDGEEQLFDRRIVDASGATRHTQASYVPDMQDGEARGFYVLVTDITARVEAEAERARSAGMYRSLVRSIPGGFVLLFDPELRFMVADGEALSAFGYEPAMLEGQTIHEAFPAALAAELESRYREALAGRSTGWDRVVGDSTYHLTAGPVRDHEGRVFAGTVVCTDVTAERRSAALDRALHAISSAIAGNGTVDEVIALVAENLSEVFGLAQVSVARFENLGEVRVVAACPPMPSLENELEIKPGDGSAVGAVAATGHPSMVRYGDTDMGTARACREDGLRAAAAAPIYVDGKLWGAIGVASREAADINHALLARLRSFAGLVEMALGNAQAWEELSRRATHDGVTGLANHRSFQEHLAREVAKAHRHGRALSLLMLDLDRFKAINDTYGHPVGDRVLAEVARRLEASARRDDLVARVGGEEFAVLMPETDLDRAISVAERTRRAIGDAPFDHVGAVTISIGACELTETLDPTGLVARADRALYVAKREGGDMCVPFATPAIATTGGRSATDRAGGRNE